MPDIGTLMIVAGGMLLAAATIFSLGPIFLKRSRPVVAAAPVVKSAPEWLAAAEAEAEEEEAAVEELYAELFALRTSVGELANRLHSVRVGLDELKPHVREPKMRRKTPITTDMDAEAA